MRVFRLTRQKYGIELSGRGASLRGGRWSSIGTELIYCAENRSLAMAEIAVHFSLGTLPSDYVMLTVECKDSIKVKTIEMSQLPQNWNAFPPPKKTQYIGDNFVKEGRFALCKIPSVVTQGDFNYLINPHHIDFDSIKVISAEPFLFDNRLF